MRYLGNSAQTYYHYSCFFHTGLIFINKKGQGTRITHYFTYRCFLSNLTGLGETNVARGLTKIVHLFFFLNRLLKLIEFLNVRYNPAAPNIKFASHMLSSG